MGHNTGGVVLMKDWVKNDLGQAAVVNIPAHEGAFIMLGLIALMLMTTLPPRRGAMSRYALPAARARHPPLRHSFSDTEIPELSSPAPD